MYAYSQVKLEADALIHYSPEVSSEILDRNGERLAFVFKTRHRLYANYDEIPGHMIEALVAIEDTMFFEHKGINPDAILRATYKVIKAGRFVEGGSTLTQQLVKNKLLTRTKTLRRKLYEAVLAVKIENELSKEQILERYLNEIFFGSNYYGVKTAAFGYFHKKLEELTLKESAILMGLPKGPSYYNPLRHYKRSLNRANSVLRRMRNIGWIGEEEYLTAVKETPKVYKSSLTQNVAPYIVDEIKRRFKGKFGDIRTGGYTIYTTIDLGMQEIARDAVKMGFNNTLKRYKESSKKTKFNGGMISVENNTGDILTLVGGVDYKKSAFNRITMTNRQPGSAFKPFIYQTALDMGYNPSTKLTDLARTFQYSKNGKKKVWAPRNYERNFEGFIPLREALVHSRNLATINLVYDIGIGTIRKRLALLDVPNIPKDLSIALGNLGISPLKMAQMYTVFSNNGHMIEPRLVSKIISKENAVLFETKPKEIANFTKPEQAYLMTDILKEVVSRGTGRKAKVKGIELTGKTGTTNDGVDAWFCGYSPTITTIVWFGRDNNRRIGKGATGGSVAAPSFAYFYRELLKLYPQTARKFSKPNGVKAGITADGKEELYTDISPLQNKKIEKTNPFDDFTQAEDGKKEDDLDSIEVIKIDEEPVIDTTGRDDDYINPIDLKRREPEKIGDDSGTLF
ncbi:MAG: PBP1A family penicillin-binding protein [Sulfurovum sp.]|nr:PBP1A family penicillin-binding protein [Sulfurovum sp.]